MFQHFGPTNFKIFALNDKKLFTLAIHKTEFDCGVTHIILEMFPLNTKKKLKLEFQILEKLSVYFNLKALCCYRYFCV